MKAKLIASNAGQNIFLDKQGMVWLGNAGPTVPIVKCAIGTNNVELLHALIFKVCCNSRLSEKASARLAYIMPE